MKVHDLDLKAQSITQIFQRNNLILLFQTNDWLWCMCPTNHLSNFGGYELGYWEWKIHQYGSSSQPIRRHSWKLRKYKENNWFLFIPTSVHMTWWKCQTDVIYRTCVPNDLSNTLLSLAIWLQITVYS